MMNRLSTHYPSIEKQNPTAKILLYASILQEPLSVLILLLPFLAIKELHATAVHISTITALAPTVAILSFYWSSIFKNSSHILRTNLIISTFLTSVFFLLTPLITNPWFYVFASTIYTLFFRAANPARMELLKRNIPDTQREKVYSWTYKVSYATGMILGPCFGIILDMEPTLWSLLFVISSSLYILSAFIYYYIPVDASDKNEPLIKNNLSQIAFEPWKKSFELIKKNPQFARFQIGFFIAGFGLMLAKPAGDWFLGNLDISYGSLFLCRTFLKGLGVLISTDVWASRLRPTTILQLAYLVAWGFFLYQLLLMGTSCSRWSLYAAYLIYGIAQSGSHLVWNLSGTLFSGKESSYQYSSVNIVAVGIRGCIAPFLGCLLLHYYGIMCTLFLGALIMFFGAHHLGHNKPINN